MSQDDGDHQTVEWDAQAPTLRGIAAMTANAVIRPPIGQAERRQSLTVATAQRPLADLTRALRFHAEMAELPELPPDLDADMDEPVVEGAEPTTPRLDHAIDDGANNGNPVHFNPNLVNEQNVLPRRTQPHLQLQAPLSAFQARMAELNRTMQTLQHEITQLQAEEAIADRPGHQLHASGTTSAALPHAPAPQVVLERTAFDRQNERMNALEEFEHARSMARMAARTAAMQVPMQDLTTVGERQAVAAAVVRDARAARSVAKATREQAMAAVANEQDRLMARAMAAVERAEAQAAVGAMPRAQAPTPAVDRAPASPSAGRAAVRMPPTVIQAASPTGRAPPTVVDGRVPAAIPAVDRAPVSSADMPRARSAQIPAVRSPSPPMRSPTPPMHSPTPPLRPPSGPDTNSVLSRGPRAIAKLTIPAITKYDDKSLREDRDAEAFINECQRWYVLTGAQELGLTVVDAVALHTSGQVSEGWESMLTQLRTDKGLPRDKTLDLAWDECRSAFLECIGQPPKTPREALQDLTSNKIQQKGLTVQKYYSVFTRRQRDCIGLLTPATAVQLFVQNLRQDIQALTLIDPKTEQPHTKLLDAYTTARNAEKRLSAQAQVHKPGSTPTANTSRFSPRSMQAGPSTKRPGGTLEAPAAKKPTSICRNCGKVPWTMQHHAVCPHNPANHGGGGQGGRGAGGGSGGGRGAGGGHRGGFGKPSGSRQGSGWKPRQGNS